MAIISCLIEGKSQQASYCPRKNGEDVASLSGINDKVQLTICDKSGTSRIRMSHQDITYELSWQVEWLGESLYEDVGSFSILKSEASQLGEFITRDLVNYSKQTQSVCFCVFT